VTHLHWSEAARQLTHDGPAAWTGPDKDVVEIAGH